MSVRAGLTCKRHLLSRLAGSRTGHNHSERTKVERRSPAAAPFLTKEEGPRGPTQPVVVRQRLFADALFARATSLLSIHVSPPLRRANKIIVGQGGAIFAGWSIAIYHRCNCAGRRLVAVGARTVEVDPTTAPNTTFSRAESIGDLLRHSAGGIEMAHCAPKRIGFYRSHHRCKCQSTCRSNHPLFQCHHISPVRDIP